MVKVYNSIHRLVEVSRYFVAYEFTFVTANTRILWHAMSAEDQRIFNFDMASLKWKEYSIRVAMGLKKFLMKEDPGTTTQMKMWWNG